MCGITGVYFYNNTIPGEHYQKLNSAVNRLNNRGPDNTGVYTKPNVLLGHSRLSIIDVTEAASQPFTDPTGRYTIIYNGEIYNFKRLRNFLQQKGFEFKSQSDTEVVLYLYILKGEKCLDDLDGFFSLAIYDDQKKSLFLARDRFGIKPLYYYHDNYSIIFASEMKALLQYDIPKNIDHSSLFIYLQLSYIPGPWTIFEDVKKLLPGHFIHIDKFKNVKEEKYYSLPLPEDKSNHSISYEQSCGKLHELLESSVVDRLISDVPLGSFLSGGIDSSIISALAAKHVDKLNTFSIGFKDEPMFDETSHANMVAKMHNTNHTVFSLTNDDLFDCLFDAINYMDEPFGDSSALAVYILSKQTRKKVTVALSGDGADELFAGYNKHMAEYRTLYPGFKEKSVSSLYPLLSSLPQSRNNPLSNKIRQIVRFGKGMNLPAPERYWNWCSIASKKDANELLINNHPDDNYQDRKDLYLDIFNKQPYNIGKTLYTDMQLVLPNDMLTKIDLMSMANSLEVRVPFLNHHLVDYVMSLPENFKIDKNNRKKILKDTFSYLLPNEIINRSKHGFEVPLLKWFRNELNNTIDNDLLENKFIKEQGIFDPKAIAKLKNKIHSPNPGEAPAKIWNLLVFQQWWKNFYENREIHL